MKNLSLTSVEVNQDSLHLCVGLFKLAYFELCLGGFAEKLAYFH